MRAGRAVVFAVAALGAFAAVAPAAGAHAQLVSSEPVDGSALARGPGEIRLLFNEAISTRFRRVSLIDGQGRVVPGTRVTGDGAALVLHAPRMPRGTYAVEWEVLAEEDGHVTGGALAFGVRAQPAPGPRTTAGAAPAPPEAALRWLDFVLLAGLLGGIATGLLTARAAKGRIAPDVVRAVRRRMLSLAAYSGGAAIVLGGVLLVRHAHDLSATLGADTSMSAVLGRLLDTRWGSLWIAREALLGVLLGAVLVLRGGTRSSLRAAVVAAAALALALVAVRALGGHAASVRPSAPAVAADAAHVLAAAVWVGGVLALALALWTVGGAAALARACARPLAWAAGVCVLVLATTGLYAAGAQVASIDALVTTAYGSTLIAKAALVVAAGALGLANFALLRPTAPGRHGRGLGLLRRAGSPRLVLAEATVGLYVLLAAALLTASAPPRGPEFAPPQAPRAPTLVRQVDDLLVSATARPNRPGVNVFSVVAVSSRRPPPGPLEGLSLRLAPAAGEAREVALRELAPGRYSGGAQLPQAGQWRMTVVMRRGGQRLTAGFGWSVSPADRARPVVVSARPLAPLVNAAAAFVLAAAAAGGLALAAARRRRPRSSGGAVMIEPFGKEAS